MSSQDLSARVVRAAQDPAAVADPDALLQAAMALGVDVAPGTVACSVTELAVTGNRTPVWSDRLALDLDMAQYAADAGPCLSAARTGTAELVAGPLAQSRYPDFAAAAHRYGVRSSLSLPMCDPLRPAALNLYAATPDAFSAGQTRAVAELLARCVSRLLPSDEPGEQSPPGSVAAAMAQRNEVRRAQDTLTAQHGLSRQEALDQLIRRSRVEGRSIHEVAEDVCGGGGTEAAS